MKQISIPSGYQQVMPYFIVQNATAFIGFMQKVFDAEEKYRTMRDESLIMHAEVRIGDSVIMLADKTEQFEVCTAGLFVYVDNADEVYGKALAEGATSLMEPSDQSYGRSCGVKDPFGNTWWLTSL